MMCGRRANWTSHGSRRRRRSLQAAGTHPGAARRGREPARAGRGLPRGGGLQEELAFAGVVIPLGLWLGHTGSERALLIGPVLLILIVELVNSAIEATVDRIGFERHALAGLAKDIGSAAVLMSFVLLSAVWLLVLLGR